MQTTWILYPLFAMALLTLVVALRMLLLRISAVRNGSLNLSYFRTNEGAKAPTALTQTTQHFDNLFEMPVLFYAIVIILYITASASPLLLVLAWSFVVLRLCHAYVHMTYNNVLHRLNVFLASTLVMFSMWFIWFGKTVLS